MSAQSVVSRAPGALSGLKRRGGGILVVGAPDEQQRLCGRLLGSSDRERLVVGTDESCLTAECHHEATVVRGQPTQATGCQTGGVLQSSSFANRVQESIRDHGERLAPAELRVCLGSIASEVLQAKVASLDAVIDELGRVNALGHVHLSESYENELVRRVEPLFDAVVQLTDEPRPQQRWHFPDHDVTTDWIDLG